MSRAAGQGPLGFDRFGIDHFNSTAARIRTLTALVAEGHGDRAHLSHNAAVIEDGELIVGPEEPPGRCS